MQLTKEKLTDAYEQGLSISTRNGNLKIVAILNDVYGVNHFNSNKVNWWLFEQFEKQEAKIEQPKPKYNGRAVKCDSVEQLQWLFKTLADSNYEIKNIDINNCFNITIVGFASEKYYIENNYEIISFSDYCKENGITEPKWIQGFEVKDGYNDVVMVSDDKISINTSFPNVEIRILKEVREHEYPFKMQDGSLFEYARYPRKNEFNEIKFSN